MNIIICITNMERIIIIIIIFIFYINTNFILDSLKGWIGLWEVVGELGLGGVDWHLEEGGLGLWLERFLGKFSSVGHLSPCRGWSTTLHGVRRLRENHLLPGTDSRADAWRSQSVQGRDGLSILVVSNARRRSMHTWACNGGVGVESRPVRRVLSPVKRVGAKWG